MPTNVAQDETSTFIHSRPLTRYPRTPHLESSRLQDGDDDSDQLPLASLAGQFVVLEEKLDGGNAGISFTEGGELLLQSRGHYLVGGASERQFGPLKAWAAAHEAALLERLEDRYVMYGECLYAKHSVWYSQAPHIFAEFDVLDRHTGRFLSTARRRELFAGSPVLSVPVLYEGPMPSSLKAVRWLVKRSLAKSGDWVERMNAAIARAGQIPELVWKQTDRSHLAEGLYGKTESGEEVLGRFKWVRSDFVQAILDSGSHHARRPVLPNELAAGVDLYAPEPTVTWGDLGLRTIRGLDELAQAMRDDEGADQRDRRERRAWRER